MKILLIENEQEGSVSLKAALKGQFLLEPSKTLEEGEYLSEINEYGLIIIYSLSNYEEAKRIARSLRARNIYTPLLVLSSQKNIQEKIEVIDSGADDYMGIPFELPEVLSHIKALTRRVSTKQIESTLRIDDLVLDTFHKTVTRSGKSINLRRKEYDLLEYFMRNPGRVISREMILNHVWSHAYEAYTNTIDVHVKYLRDQIDKPFSKKLIKTIHGFGYKISV